MLHGAEGARAALVVVGGAGRGIHSPADETLADRCSRRLYARAREPEVLVPSAGDDHGRTRCRRRALAKLHGCKREP